jgi:phosphatidylserine/phosphatidylglycerophosphate/cardiolipin synthase-like enzyme
MEHYSLPSQYDRLMDELRHHLANVDEDGRIVLVSYIMPCPEIMEMVEEAAARGISTLVVVDAAHAMPGAVAVRCHGSEAMHAKFLVAGEVCVVGSWNFGKRGGIDSVFIEQSDWDMAQQLAHEAENLVEHSEFTERINEEVAAKVAKMSPRSRFGRSIRRQIARKGTLSGPQIAAILHRR